jgi:hypothetical protein
VREREEKSERRTNTNVATKGVHERLGLAVGTRSAVTSRCFSSSAAKVRLYEAGGPFVNSAARDGPAQLTCAGDMKAHFKVKE